MKKLFFALACVIGLMTFASCTQEVIDELLAQKPAVEFVAGEGYIVGNTSVYVGTELNFKVKVAPNSGSQSELSHIDISITDKEGTTVYNDNPEFTDPAGENIFEWSFTPETASTYLVTVTVTDKAKKTNTITAVVDYVMPVAEGIGTFSGTLTFSGHITSNEIAGQPAYDQDMDPEEVPATIVLGALEENGRVSATFEVENSPVTLYGTMEDNTITFDEFHFNKTLSLQITNVVLDLTANFTGVLENDVLTVTGTAVGSGKTMITLVYLEVNLTNGVVEGSLDKVVE